MKSITLRDPLRYFDRAPTELVLENLTQALRVLDLVPRADCELMPHPLVIVRAEIENAKRYLSACASDLETQPTQRNRRRKEKYVLARMSE